MQELWQELKEFWTKQDIKLGTPATLAEIEQFEVAHQVKLPNDFKLYLLSVNGMNDRGWETDGDFICFWPLHNIKILTEEYPDWSESVENANEYFIFADHLIRSHDFAVRLTSEETTQTQVYVLYFQPQMVATSFTEFIQQYIAEDRNVTFPDLK